MSYIFCLVSFALLGNENDWSHWSLVLSQTSLLDSQLCVLTELFEQSRKIDWGGKRRIVETWWFWIIFLRHSWKVGWGFVYFLLFCGWLTFPNYLANPHFTVQQSDMVLFLNEQIDFQKLGSFTVEGSFVEKHQLSRYGPSKIWEESSVHYWSIAKNIGVFSWTYRITLNAVLGGWKPQNLSSSWGYVFWVRSYWFHWSLLSLVYLNYCFL